MNPNGPPAVPVPNAGESMNPNGPPAVPVPNAGDSMNPNGPPAVPVPNAGDSMNPNGPPAAPQFTDRQTQHPTDQSKLSKIQTDGSTTPPGMQTNFELKTTSKWKADDTWSQWSRDKCNSALGYAKDKIKQAHDIAKTYASGISDTLKNTTNQKVRSKSPPTLTGPPTDDKTPPASGMPNASAVIARRRLQNRPKSHVVVLERLLEEIRESERNCKLRRR